MAATRLKTIAMTGSTGFVGGNLIDQLLDAGYHVKALVRRPQKERAGVTWVAGALDHEEALKDLVSGAHALVHVAGLTKARALEDYFAINHRSGALLFDKAEAAGLDRVINISSMAARAPELSPYGASKAALDDDLASGRWSFPYVSIRPPAIYGPGEQEILKAIKLARGEMGPALYPSPAPLDSRAGFIHVADLCAAILALLVAPHADIGQRIGELDDGRDGGYTPAEVASAMAGGKSPPRVIHIRQPLRSLIGAASELYGKLRGQAVITTRAHLTYLSHPDWSVESSKRLNITGFTPHFDLKDGMADAIRWYQEHGLLR